jgi:hypothetical protein
MLFMKKAVVMLFAVVITASAWANPTSPIPSENEKVQAAFLQQFAEAKDVAWTEKKGIYLASFKLNNDRMLAWYTEDGEVTAVHRSIELHQMTFLAAEAVKKMAENKQLLNIGEISKEGELFYIVRIDDEKCTSTYRMSTSGEQTRIEKIKKKK